MPPTNKAAKAEAIRLRTEERLSYSEIHAILGVSKGTLSGWLRDYPLTDAEKKAKMGGRGYQTPKKDRGQESDLHRLAVGGLTGQQKAKVAEAAVLLRLVLRGMAPFGSVFDGDKTDWLVETPEGNIHKVQVKWCRLGSTGLPYIVLRCTEGHSTRRRYKKGEFDFIVGYDLFTDTCYVWSWDEVKDNKSTVTICPEAEERWDKIIGA